jgi:hypothetical protein
MPGPENPGRLPRGYRHDNVTLISRGPAHMRLCWLMRSTIDLLYLLQ